ncbi:hypothetical protein SAMN05216359_1077 [Roseateles sp. YR242]|nr:hypothetical protein SAMN05216359_1077 [Roseateles sp. YR242]
MGASGRRRKAAWDAGLRVRPKTAWRAICGPWTGIACSTPAGPGRRRGRAAAAGQRGQAPLRPRQGACRSAEVADLRDPRVGGARLSMSAGPGRRRGVPAAAGQRPPARSQGLGPARADLRVWRAAEPTASPSTRPMPGKVHRAPSGVLQLIDAGTVFAVQLPSQSRLTLRHACSCRPARSSAITSTSWAIDYTINYCAALTLHL